jgi:hypothetical protein
VCVCTESGTSDCVPKKPISANLQTIWFLWGVNGVDRSQADINNPFDTYLGEPIYDDTFDIADPNAQRAVDAFLLNITETERLSTCCCAHTFVICLAVERTHEATIFPDLKLWLLSKGYAFPIPRRQNASLLLAQFILKYPWWVRSICGVR